MAESIPKLGVIVLLFLIGAICIIIALWGYNVITKAINF